MSELWRIVLTSSITIAGGVIVYTLGHLFVALFVEPIHRLRSLIGEIADSLVFYANVYGNPGDVQKQLMDEASETLRRQSSQLRARVGSIPWYPLWAFMRLVQEKREIEEASKELMGLSNSVHGGLGITPTKNVRTRRRIEQLLDIGRRTKQKKGQPINSRMLSNGVLLFFFSLILLAVQPRTLVLFGFEIFTFPIWSYTALGIIALLISISLMIAVFWKSLAVKLERFLEERQKGSWRAVLQYLYFVVFWLVYTVGWLKGLSAISAERFIFGVVFCFGFIWFVVIPAAWFRVFFQRRE